MLPDKMTDSAALVTALQVAGLVEAAADDQAATAVAAAMALEDMAHATGRWAAKNGMPAPPSVRMRHAVMVLSARIDDTWLPALADGLGKSLNGGIATGALDIAHAIRVLSRVAGGSDGRRGCRAALSEAACHIRAETERCGAALAVVAGADDAPDMTALSLECMRFEGLRFLAESLGDRRTAEEFAYISRRVARIGLTRATATVNAYLKSRDMLHLFDNAVVLGRIDDAMTLALRLLEALAVGEEEVTPLVVPADKVAMDGFVAVIDRLAGVLLTLLRRAVTAQSGNGAIVASLFGQLGCIGRFCRLLSVVDGDAAHERLNDLGCRLQGGLGMIGDGLYQRLTAVGTPAEADGGAFLALCARAAAAAAQRMGDNSTAERLAAGINAASSRLSGR